MPAESRDRRSAWSLGRWLAAVVAAAVLLFVLQVIFTGGTSYAQKQQGDFGDKLSWGTETAGVALACSADGKHVYVAGPKGVLVSEDFGKTGTWSLVLKGK